MVTELNDSSSAVADLLRRLADPGDGTAAALALHALWLERLQADIDAGRDRTSADHDAEDHAILSAAIAELGPAADALVPAWVDLYVAMLRAMHAETEARVAAVRRNEDWADMDTGPIFGSIEVRKVLQAAGDRLDPHLGRLAAAFGTAGPHGDDWLPEAMHHAGPGLARVVPALFELLRARGVWSRPSRVALALKRAAEFDPTVVPTLRQMLAGDDAAHRKAAAAVLAEIGPAAGPAADELLASESGDEEERCGGLYALAGQRPATAAALDLIERALRDANGYVRRAAAYAAGELRADAGRFVPLLVGACDDREFLHDESLPEAAVDALAKYGPAAGAAAVARLRRFLDGPLADRTIEDPAPVRRAIAAITGVAAVPALPAVALRPTPAGVDEPLWAVEHDGRLCYVDVSGAVVLRTAFGSGEPFHGDRALAHDGDGTVVIDRGGRVVFRSEWDEVKPFGEGLAAVRRGERWGFVDADGRVVVEPQYTSVTRFAEGLAGVATGAAAVPFLGEMTVTRPTGRGFIDRAGAVAIPLRYSQVQPFSHGRAVACLGFTMRPNVFADDREVPSDHRYGLLDRAGHVVVDGIYGGIGPFAGGLAAAFTGMPILKGRHGYIDVDGRIVIPLMYTAAGPFRDGLAVVKRRGHGRRQTSVVIDVAGRVVAELDRQIDWRGFSQGLVAAYFGELWGAIDVAGRTAVEPQFDDLGPFADGLAVFSRGKWNGLADRTGRIVWGPTEQWVHSDHQTLTDEWA